MNDALLALHFIGLMMGAGGGFGSAIVARVANSKPPEQAATLRTLGPILARFAHIGLGILWVTGLIMIWSVYGGPEHLPELFWIKAIFIVSLTVAAIATELTYADIKKGNMKAAARLPKIGPIAGISALLAAVTAAFAFH
ncbi:MAG TPA: hypothetical protein VG841_10790 [Caulobacterales bacterium]|nr:hypothetical protein [Caulobacterales bacterium]